MKLLLCTFCSDVVRMFDSERTCKCGQSHGRYTDQKNLDFEGPCIVFGIGNNDLIHQVRKYADDHQGHEVNAFIIPDSASTVHRRVNSKPPQLVSARQILEDFIKEVHHGV